MDTGETWGIYGQNGLAHGAIHGNVSASRSVFSGAGTDYYLYGGAILPINVSGTYTPAGSMSGDIGGVNPGTFKADFDSNYLRPASVSDVAGSWIFRAASAGGITNTPVTISSTGQVSSNQAGCTQTGTVRPHRSGKNVFDVSLSYSGPNCLFDQRTLAGVGVLSVGARRTLTVAVLLPDGTDGFLATASK
ncbi:hypothetical protein [Piscinibacter koreensis]|uniref:Uncharacterized protein n=1 Tax=Piscinibacter koreensis TaxID=2742824 RepID=A0A7Y6NQS3_9BURK|nr:hypothetical protein [Schlegelella koreensis]NUZ07617.1 hypothetical protein [Schlegelella koreensis]